MRETYVMRGGKLVPKSQAMPATTRIHVISDTMPGMVHPATGRMMDSKSRFRAETRARGYTEIGNDKQVDRRKLDLPPLNLDIARAISELGG